MRELTQDPFYELIASDYDRCVIDYCLIAPEDFVRVNAALFPEGADALEVLEWTTDWSNYFDAGHEWWGAACWSAYDGRLGRFAVMLASATD